MKWVIFILSLTSTAHALPTAEQLCQKIEERDTKGIESLLKAGASIDDACPLEIRFSCAGRSLLRANPQGLSALGLASDNIGRASLCPNPKFKGNGEAESLAILSLLMKYKPNRPMQDESFNLELTPAVDGMKLRMVFDDSRP